MNIYEAVKSGRRFRIAGRAWIEEQVGPGFHTYQFTWDQLESNAWEVEEEVPIRITKSDFIIAAHKAMREQRGITLKDYPFQEMLESLLRRLFK